MLMLTLWAILNTIRAAFRSAALLAWVYVLLLPKGWFGFAGLILISAWEVIYLIKLYKRIKLSYVLEEEIAERNLQYHISGHF